MTNSKNIVSQLIVILIILGNAGYSSVIKAGGLAVIDIANIKQTTTTAIENVAQTLKQIEQYQTQLQQYENMIRNTLAPPAYVWAQAQYTMNRLLYLTNTIR